MRKQPGIGRSRASTACDSSSLNTDSHTDSNCPFTSISLTCRREGSGDAALPPPGRSRLAPSISKLHPRQNAPSVTFNSNAFYFLYLTDRD